MPADNKIQSYAFVAVLDATTLEVRAASENLIAWLGGDAGAVVGQPGTSLFSAAVLQSLTRSQGRRVPLPQDLSGEPDLDWGKRQAIPFFVEDLLVVEIEPQLEARASFDREIALHSITESMTTADGLNALLDLVCASIADYLGLSRVVAYQFEGDGLGIIRNEFNDGSFPSLLKLRFRPDDYPEEGYRLHSQESVLAFCTADDAEVAIVGDVGSAANAINYRLGCRTPYLVLDQFARESGITTVLSLALFVEGKPWGVLFGHSHEALHFDYQLRTFLHLVGTLTSQTIAFRIVEQVRRRVLQTDVIRSRLREYIAGAPTLIDGLTSKEHSVLKYIGNTTGAAIFAEDQLATVGTCPSEEEITRLFRWAEGIGEGQSIYFSDHLEYSYAPGERFRDKASGVILLPLNSRRTEWIAWFRPEKVEEVKYGSLDQSAQPALPSERFLTTVEIRRGYSSPWTSNQVKAANELQPFIRDIVMERYSQLRRINQQLRTAYDEMEDFSYMVSHDLRAPLRGIDGFAEILLEDYGNGIDEDGRELIQVIQHNAARMNQFIADILELSRIGRAKIIVNKVEVKTLVQEALQEISRVEDTKVEVEVPPDLPPIYGDRQQLAIVFRQLIANAVKFSGKRQQPSIKVGFRPARISGEGEFFVSDNGMGIPPIHHQRVFGMFNRLVTQEEYVGNGVGLAIVRRIINRHNGEIRIESAVDEGATFLFYTNIKQLKDSN